MFGRNKFGQGKAGGMFGKSNKNPSSKKQSTRNWMAMQKEKNEPVRTRHETHFDIDKDDDDDAAVAGVAGAAGVMTDTSPSLPPLQSPNYVELPDEPRPGKITPTTPSSTTNSSPSPRGNIHRSNGKSSGSSEANNTGATVTADEEEAIEEAVPIVRTTLPSPEPRPLVERNGYGKDHHDKVDSSINNGFKAKPYPAQRDVDEDSCLIKCVYFTQQCCECTIV